ncbi:GumC family protein [Phycisphaerales bacterium AB-hyl4]|uniref:GumC family protein n=1 Tax=Natronomicrosphaera hydrolytica TaxID=3242702 RepID=A0ABV4U3T6_9BACT
MKSSLPAAPRHEPSVRASASELDRSIIEVLWQRRGVVLTCLVVALLVGGVYGLTAPRQYRSTAQLFLQQTAGADAPLGGSALQSATPAAHRLMMTSSAVLRAAVETLPAEVHAYAGDDPARYLRHNLEVAAAGGEGILTVSLQGTDPEAIAQLVNHVVRAYKDRVRVTATGQLVTREAGPTAEDADGGTEGEAERPSGMSRRAIAQQFEQLSVDRTVARLRARRLEALLEQARTTDGLPANLAALLDAAEPDAPPRQWLDTRDLESRVENIDAALAMYTGRLGRQHQTVRALLSQRGEVEQRIKARERAAGRQMLAHLMQLHDEAQAREADLADTVSRWRQYAAAAQTEALPVAEIDPALADHTPVAPRLSRVLAGSGVGGLMVGMLLALAMDLSARRREAVVDTHQQLDNAEDIDLSEVAAPLYGSVPAMHNTEADSPDAEATAMSMHQIRALLQLHASAEDKRAFAVTSPSRGAGKTSIAVGLASSLGLSGTRTLLVDCDLAGRMRRERSQSAATGEAAQNVGDVMHEMGYIAPAHANGEHDATLPTQRRPVSQLGLPGMLDGKPLADCVISTSIAELFVLPAVFVEQRHVAQLSTRFILDLIESAKADYDMILFDTGPVPGGAEPLLVAGAVDGVVLVAARGESRARFNRTLAYLRAIGARVVGTVFNRAESDEDMPPESTNSDARQRYNRADNFGSGLLAMAVCGKAGAAESSEDQQRPETVRRAERQASPSASGLDANFFVHGAASPEDALQGLEPLTDNDFAADDEPIKPSFWERAYRKLMRPRP